MVTAIVSASRLLWSGLVWFLGDRLDVTWTAHFDDAAVELAGVAVGALVWWYHRALLEGSVAERGEVHRIYEYLVAGIALVAAATGVGTILVALVEAVTPGVDIGMTTMNTLLAALTLLLVGVPVWWWHWRGVRAAVAAGPADEVTALPRRVYLVLLFGVAGVAAVIALLVAGYNFFRDLVDAQLGAATLRLMRYALGVLVASAAISAYHGAVFQTDRAVVPNERLPGPRSVVLVGPDDPQLPGGCGTAPAPGSRSGSCATPRHRRSGTSRYRLHWPGGRVRTCWSSPAPRGCASAGGPAPLAQSGSTGIGTSKRSVRPAARAVGRVAVGSTDAAGPRRPGQRPAASTWNPSAGISDSGRMAAWPAAPPPGPVAGLAAASSAKSTSRRCSRRRWSSSVMVYGIQFSAAPWLGW